MRGVVTLGLLVPMVIVSVSEAATIKFDQSEYWADPGMTFVTEVLIQIEVTTDAANVGFKAEAVPMLGSAGTLTTSMADVSQSNDNPYIFTPNAGFFDTGTADSIALGGDNTDDGMNDSLMPGDYYLAEITWNVSPDATGDFMLSFVDEGIITVLTPDWTLPEVNLLNGYSGAVIHVPEPSALVISGLGAILVVLRRRE